jgi:hypothetical protein
MGRSRDGARHRNASDGGAIKRAHRPTTRSKRAVPEIAKRSAPGVRLLAKFSPHYVVRKRRPVLQFANLGQRVSVVHPAFDR